MNTFTYTYVIDPTTGEAKIVRKDKHGKVRETAVVIVPPRDVDPAHRDPVYRNFYEPVPHEHEQGDGK